MVSARTVRETIRIKKSCSMKFWQKETEEPRCAEDHTAVFFDLEKLFGSLTGKEDIQVVNL